LRQPCQHLASEPQAMRRLTNYLRFGGAHYLYCRDIGIEKAVW